MAERIFLLHRALTIRDMGTKEMRTQHDAVPEWVFKDPSGKDPFTKGTIRMDKDDINKAMDMYYEEMDWDKKTGAPNPAAYQKVALGKVAEELNKKGLLP